MTPKTTYLTVGECYRQAYHSFVITWLISWNSRSSLRCKHQNYMARFWRKSKEAKISSVQKLKTAVSWPQAFLQTLFISLKEGKKKGIYMNLCSTILQGNTMGTLCSLVPLHQGRQSVEHNNNYFHRSSVLDHNVTRGSCWFLVNFRSTVKSLSCRYSLWFSFFDSPVLSVLSLQRRPLQQHKNCTWW